MTEQNEGNTQANFTAKWVRWAGSLASLAIAILYLVIIVLYAIVGPQPSGGEARLDYLIGKTEIWWAIVSVSVLTNFLYVPLAVSLYLVLRKLNHFAMLIGSAFVGLFVIFENAVNWTTYGSLIILSQNYVAATSGSQKEIYIAAANFASSILDSPLAAVWAIGTLSFGILVIGFIMLKSEFGKYAAYLGILTGISGIFAVAGVGIAVIINALLATIWLFLISYKFNRLAIPSQ